MAIIMSYFYSLTDSSLRGRTRSVGRLPAFLALTAIAIAWTGPGRYSLDAVAGLTRDWTTWPAVAATVIGIGAALAMRLALHGPQLAAKTEGRLA
jgi:hypothetical protein